MLRKVIGTGIVLLGVLHVQNAVAQDWSANLGFNSEYIYRGIPQKSSSAFGGVDFAAGGFSAGAWTADVGDGVEVEHIAPGRQIASPVIGVPFKGHGLAWFDLGDDIGS